MHQWCPEYHSLRQFLTWLCDKYYILWYFDKYHILWHCDKYHRLWLCDKYHILRHFDNYHILWHCEKYHILWHCDKYHILWHCDNVTYGQLETNHKSGGWANPQQQLDDGFLLDYWGLDYWGIRGLIPTTLPCSILDMLMQLSNCCDDFCGDEKIRALCGNHQYSSHKVASFVICF